MKAVRLCLVTMMMLSLTWGAVFAQGSHPKKVLTGNVKKVVTVVNPKVWNGPAPAHLTFTGTIFVNNPPVDVEYTWVRSDGARGPVLKARITSAGEGFTDTWDVGVAKKKMKVWERLEVLSPRKASSNPAVASVNCK